MYQISVIIPVYNAQDYLEKTINSVINQSIGFEKLELILVDDNSKDNSREIIDKYCEKYDNIIPYYSNENHGFPGFGRNIGLKLSTAPYVMFLDNDDEYDKDICKRLYDVMIDEDVDLVSCGRILIDHISEIKDNYLSNETVGNYIIYDGDNALSFNSVTIWNKIFKKEIIDNFGLKFLENSSADDFAFSVDYHIKSKRIMHLSDYYGYYWNIRNESLSHEIKIEHIEEVLNAYNYIISNIIEENKLEQSSILLRHMVLLLVSKCSFLNVDLKTYKRILNDIYDFEQKINFNQSLTDKFFDFANKLLLHKFFFLTIFYFKILKILRKITFLRKINRSKQK